MTRIAHLTTAHPVLDNRIFRKECQALVEAGFDVTLVAVHDADEIIDGVRVVALPRRKGRASRMGLGPVDAWRRLRTLQPDIIHGHDPELIPLLVAYRLTHRNARVIFDAHEHLPKQVAGKPYLPERVRPVVAGAAQALEKLADRVLDAVVVATPHIAEHFSADKVVLVQNFPWLRDFPTPRPYPRHDDGVTILSYVGATSRGRGSEIMGKLPTLTRNATRVIAAGILAADAEADMEGKADVGVEFRGKLRAEEIPDLIADSNIGLSILLPLPNYLDAQATKMFEYMAAARPFVASNFPYWVELFGSYDCGIFVDPEDPVAVAAAVDRLAENPDQAATMGQNGRTAVENRFSFENEALRLVELVTRLAAK